LLANNFTSSCKTYADSERGLLTILTSKLVMTFKSHQTTNDYRKRYSSTFTKKCVELDISEMASSTDMTTTMVGDMML